MLGNRAMCGSNFTNDIMTHNEVIVSCVGRKVITLISVYYLRLVKV